MTDMNTRFTALAASYADEKNWRAEDESPLVDKAITIRLEGHEVMLSTPGRGGWCWSIAPHDREEIDDDNAGEYSVLLTLAEAKEAAFDALLHIIQTEDEVAAENVAGRAAFESCRALMFGLAPLQKARVLTALRNWVDETTKGDPFLEGKRNEAFSIGDVYQEPNLRLRFP
jgi:hypothetical protein